MQEKKKVIIVDDEPDLCLLMKTYFLRKNYEVFIAHNCGYATQQAKEVQPDIILLNSSVCGNSQYLIQKLQEAAPNTQLITNIEQWLNF